VVLINGAIEGNTMILFLDGKKLTEHRYATEEDFERDVVLGSKRFFGKETVYIDAKKKIESKALGGAIPDGFLFDLSDKENPEFYLVEVELSKHSFYNHIFPQITKFFAFFRNKKSQGELVEKLFSIISSDDLLRQEFKRFLGEREIYKFLKDVLDNSQNILIIIDGEKNELPEITETYTDTWGKLVKILILKKFCKDGDSVYSMTPDFQDIEYAFVEPVDAAAENQDVQYSEEYHLESTSAEVKEVYYKIKDDLLKTTTGIVFNPQKIYISIRYRRNIAYFKILKSRIRLVIMLPEQVVRSQLHHTTVHTLSERVQRYYNGPCCELIIDNLNNVNEVSGLIKNLIGSVNQTEIVASEEQGLTSIEMRSEA
jgi:predicted transport protein